MRKFMLPLRNFIQGEGIPSPLAPSLLIAFYDMQKICWCYSYDVITTPKMGETAKVYTVYII